VHSPITLRAPLLAPSAAQRHEHRRVVWLYRRGKPQRPRRVTITTTMPTAIELLHTLAATPAARDALEDLWAKLSNLSGQGADDKIPHPAGCG